MYNEQTQFDIDHLIRVSRFRCIQVADCMTTDGYIDYHKLDRYKNQEQKNAEQIIDYIVDPEDRWKDAKGVARCTR